MSVCEHEIPETTRYACDGGECGRSAGDSCAACGLILCKTHSHPVGAIFYCINCLPEEVPDAKGNL